MNQNQNAVPDSARVLLVVGKGVFLFVGVVVAIVLFEALLSSLDLFLDPKYKSFWADVDAYHANPRARKSDAEYIRQYGFEPVSHYMLNADVSGAYLPSEEVAKASVKWYVITQKGNGGTAPIVSGFLFAILVVCAPVAFTARQVQRLVARAVSLTSRSAEVRKAYFAKLTGAGAFWSTIGAFAVALVMAAINSSRTITPEDEARGLTVPDFAGALLFLGYTSGLWMRLVSHVVDVGFIALGRNPHKSIWDNVITLAVTAPVLILVFNNSWLAVLTGAVTGLATAVFAKWGGTRQEPQKADPVSTPTPSSSGAIR